MLFQITPLSIEVETKKAILIIGCGWLPKSQVNWLEKNDEIFLHVPAWLAFKKGMSKWTNTGVQIAWKFTLDECLEAGGKIVNNEVYSQ